MLWPSDRLILKVPLGLPLFDIYLQQTICPSFLHYFSVSFIMHIEPVMHNPSQWGTSWAEQECKRKRLGVRENAYSQIPLLLVLGTVAPILRQQYDNEGRRPAFLGVHSCHQTLWKAASGS